MSIIIGILYVILVITCLFLALLILVQLPKKDAGAGMAFGGGAGEALFGAGSGNVLTKLTKWSATVFLVLALLLSVVVSSVAEKKKSAIDEGLAAEDGSPVPGALVAEEPVDEMPEGTISLDAGADPAELLKQVTNALQQVTSEVPAETPDVTEEIEVPGTVETPTPEQ